jgi:hypothetical protein
MGALPTFSFSHGDTPIPPSWGCRNDSISGIFHFDATVDVQVPDVKFGLLAFGKEFATGFDK